MGSLVRQSRDYLVSSVAELRKVLWPSRRAVVNHTIVIVVSVAIVTALVGLLDYGLTVALKDIIIAQ